jgi:hypothetical protein
VEILSGDQHSSVAGNNVEEVVDLLLVVHGYLRLALVAPVIQTKRKSINDMKSNLKEGFSKSNMNREVNLWKQPKILLLKPQN